MFFFKKTEHVFFQENTSWQQGEQYTSPITLGGGGGGIILKVHWNLQIAWCSIHISLVSLIQLRDKLHNVMESSYILPKYLPEIH